MSQFCSNYSSALHLLVLSLSTEFTSCRLHLCQWHTHTPPLCCRFVNSCFLGLRLCCRCLSCCCFCGGVIVFIFSFVLNMFSRFPIAPGFNPICFAQSPPLLTYIAGPKAKAPHFPIEFSTSGSLHNFNFLSVIGQSNWPIAKKRKKLDLWGTPN